MSKLHWFQYAFSLLSHNPQFFQFLMLYCSFFSSYDSYLCLESSKDQSQICHASLQVRPNKTVEIKFQICCHSAKPCDEVRLFRLFSNCLFGKLRYALLDLLQCFVSLWILDAEYRGWILKWNSLFPLHIHRFCL